MSDEQKKADDQGVQLQEGHLVATFSGVMSACFSYGLTPASRSRKSPRRRRHRPTLWQGLPVLVVVLLGGFTTNFIWCVLLNIRNRTGYQYFSPTLRQRARRSARTKRSSRRPSTRRAKKWSTHAPGEPGRRRQTAACRCSGNYFFSRPGRHHLVHAVLLLHHGRDPDGRVQVLELDPAHGQHHHLQHALGHRPARMEGEQQADAHADRHRPGCAVRLDDHRRLRQLPEGVAADGTLAVGRKNRLGSSPDTTPHGRRRTATGQRVRTRAGAAPGPLGFKSFVGMYAGEHTAGTELMIGPLFVAHGVSAFDLIVGLLLGNLLAVLSWRSHGADRHRRAADAVLPAGENLRPEAGDALQPGQRRHVLLPGRRDGHRLGHGRRRVVRVPDAGPERRVPEQRRLGSGRAGRRRRDRRRRGLRLRDGGQDREHRGALDGGRLPGLRHCRLAPVHDRDR